MRVREREQREEASGSSEEESSDEGGNEAEDAASDDEEPSTPEGFFEVAELRRTRGKGASMQVLVRWRQEGADDSWEPVQYLSEDQQRAARRIAGAARRLVTGARGGATEVSAAWKRACGGASGGAWLLRSGVPGAYGCRKYIRSSLMRALLA